MSPGPNRTRVLEQLADTPAVRWLRVRLRATRREPVTTAEAFVHHGYRAVLVLAVAIWAPIVFPDQSGPGFLNLQPGDVAVETVNASFQFVVPKDEEQLASDQRDAEAGVLPIVSFNPALVDSALLAYETLMASVGTAVDSGTARAIADEADREEVLAAARGAVGDTLAAHGLTVVEVDIDYVMDPRGRNELAEELTEALGGLRAGVMRSGDLEGLQTAGVVVREVLGEGEEPDLSGSGDDFRPIDDIPLMSAFYQEANEAARGELPPSGLRLFSQLLVQAEPTLQLDSDATRLEREAARAAVPRIAGRVLRDERIITENRRIDNLAYQRLMAYQAELSERGLATAPLTRELGLSAIVAAGLLILLVAMYRYRLDVYQSPRSFAALMAVFAAVLAGAGVVAAVDAPVSLIPVALAGLTIAALYDGMLALLSVACLALILLALPAAPGPEVPLNALVAGSAAALAARAPPTRSQSWKVMAVIAGSHAVIALCLFLGEAVGLQGSVSVIGWGVVSAVLCTTLALAAVIPALEQFTGRVTDQTLLELSNMNRPLLRRLAREAPGTYSHSINLANLVEAACEGIGANPILGRVGAYYHDIGKLKRPQYFVENQPRGLNPHDRLTPWQSAEILKAHVRDGVAMAQEAGVPERLQDFIREHHGTQPIRFFLQRAREQTDGPPAELWDFSYPGPKPQSRETAVAMLGDAVEAASRTLRAPNPETIRDLISGLFQDRIQWGELDECGLTHRDIKIVQREFARTLTGLFHHRIDYPSLKRPEAPEPGGSRAGGSGGGTEGEIADGPGTDSRLKALQMSIGLTQAAHGDTGPVPKVAAKTTNAEPE